MLRDIRKQYQTGELNETEVSKSPYEQFSVWLNDALRSSEPEPTAMILSTVDSEGQPHSRVVLLKDFRSDGLVFFSNYNSHKGGQLSHNNRVAVLFFWETLERQVRITGTVRKTDAATSDDYFNSRPLDSRIGAAASPQSAVILNKTYLEVAFNALKESAGEHITRPEHWGGYCITPDTFEFWQGRPNRLHDRLYYSRNNSTEWTIERLAP